MRINTAEKIDTSNSELSSYISERFDGDQIMIVEGMVDLAFILGNLDSGNFVYNRELGRHDDLIESLDTLIDGFDTVWGERTIINFFRAPGRGFDIRVLLKFSKVVIVSLCQGKVYFEDNEYRYSSDDFRYLQIVALNLLQEVIEEKQLVEDLRVQSSKKSWVFKG
jgi:hypothetical protein